MSRTKSWSFRIRSPRGALVSRRFVTSRENQRKQLTKHTKALSESNSGGLFAQISSKVILIFPIFRSKAMIYSKIWCRILLKSVLHLMTEQEEFKIEIYPVLLHIIIQVLATRYLYSRVNSSFAQLSLKAGFCSLKVYFLPHRNILLLSIITV